MEMVADKAGGGNTPKKGEQGFQKSTAGKKAPVAKINTGIEIDKPLKPKKISTNIPEPVTDFVSLSKDKKVIDSQEESGIFFDIDNGEVDIQEVLNPVDEVKLNKQEDFLTKAKEEMLKEIDLNKKPSNSEVNDQIEKARIDKDRIFKEFEDKNAAEFDELYEKKKKELANYVEANKGIMKILRRINFKIEVEEILSSKKYEIVKEEDDMYYALSKVRSQVITVIEKQYNGGKGPEKKDYIGSGLGGKSRHDNSSQTSGNGSGSNGGSGGGSY